MRLTVTLHIHDDDEGPDGRIDRTSIPDAPMHLHLYGSTARDFCGQIDGPHTAQEIASIVDCYGDNPHPLYDEEEKRILDKYDTDVWPR